MAENTDTMKSDLAKIVEVLGTATKAAGLACVVYLLRTVLSDAVIGGAVVTAVYFITRIWV